MDKELFIYWSRRVIAWYLIGVAVGVAAYQAIVDGDYELMKMVLPMAAAIVGFYFALKD